MRYGLVTSLLFLFTGSVKPLVAQQYIFKTYAMNDGLVHNAVRKIYQDSKGFVWIGTWEGLSKYDGHRFTNYAGVKGLGNGLVNDILEINDSSIYITCNDGGIYRIAKNGLPERINAAGIVVNKLKLLPGNRTVALTDFNGICEFKDEKFLKLGATSTGKRYYNLVSFSDSLLLVQSDSSLQVFSGNYQLVSEQIELSPLYSECGMLKDSKGRIWIGTTRGLRLLSPVLENGVIDFKTLPAAFNHALLKGGRISAIHEDKEGNLWFGTPSGVLKIGSDGLQQLIAEKNGLPANDVFCIYQDKEENIWVGGSRGVARLVTATSIRLFRTEDGLASNNVFHIMPMVDGDLLTKSGNVTQVYKSSTDKFEPVPNNLSLTGKKPDLHSMSDYRSNYRYLVFNQDQSHFTYFSPTTIGEYYAFKDRFGTYFTNSTSGILISKDLKNWKNSFLFSDTRTVMLDTKGDLWAGTVDSGLFRLSYHNNGGSLQLTGQKHFLPGMGIRSLYEDRKGNIWVGSRYHGVYCISKEGDIVLQFDQGSGLTSNRITSIAEDKNGAIWLSFYSGLDKLVPEKNGFRVFNFSRFHNFFTNIQVMIFDSRHSLWLGTTQGLANISDGEAEKNLPLKAIITSAVLGDSVYQGAANKVINLGYRQNRVYFEYSAPSFINGRQVLFSYRLLGSNNSDWTEPSNEHSVSYASLRPGDYRFEVRTLGWNNKWSDVDKFEFQINSPFWQTWWFRICAAMLVSGLVFSVVRRRIKTIRRESEMKQKLAETEMAALRAQMNPHFIFNSLNSIENFIMQNEKRHASDYLNKFARLIRMILDSSRNELVPVSKDLEALQLYIDLEQLRFGNKFSYRTIVDPELLSGDYRVPSLIIQPYVENAIVHGLAHSEDKDLNLIVTVSLENDTIRYVVLDNGVGREKAAGYNRQNRPHHKSVGLKITEDRISNLNINVPRNQSVRFTDLYNGDNKPAGTKVEITLNVF